MSVYTREIEFTAASGEANLATLPAPMRGTIGRLAIKQISGVAAGFTARLLNRRGASSVGTDLNVRGGVLTSISDNGSGKCRLTVAAAAAMVGVRVGDTVEVKGSSVSGYNVLTHTVTAIVDATHFDTDKAYTAPGTGGRWQTAPTLPPTLADPDGALVVDAITAAGASYSASPNAVYTNRDNQNSTARRMAQALYLEITPGGTGNKAFLISYTILPALVD